MSGTDIFIDTNICIYLLNGDVVLADMLQGQNLYISIITEMELLAYHAENISADQPLYNFLQSVLIINIEEKVKINAVKVRRQSKLKLPDSIVAASALTYDLPLMTADHGFKKMNYLDLVIYQNN